MNNNEKTKRDDDFLIIKQDGEEELNLPVLLESLLVRLMGKALDYGRMSDQSDRSLAQFTRSIKDATYDLSKFGKAILKKHGYEDISSSVK